MNNNDIKIRIEEILAEKTSGPLPTSSVAEIMELVSSFKGSDPEVQKTVESVKDLRLQSMVESDPLKRVQLAALIISEKLDKGLYDQ